MGTATSPLTVVQPTGRCPDCGDLDDDCHDVKDKTACWLYDPARGMCPYLRSDAPGNRAKE